MKKYKSIFDIKDHIPEHTYEWHNKPISKWSDDNFADYVFDRCDLNNVLGVSDDHWLRNIHYLEHIPQSYARVYLYGVWSCVKEVLRINAKEEKAKSCVNA